MAKRRKATGKELIEKLSKDWLERAGESFVKIRTKGRLGWEESLKKALDLLEISFLDHIIISDSRWYSFADECVTEFGK